MYPCNLSALPIKTNGAFPLLCCDKIEHNEWHLESAKLQAASRSYHVLLLQCHLLTFFTKQNVYLICSFLRMHLLKSRSPGGGGQHIYIYIDLLHLPKKIHPDFQSFICFICWTSPRYMEICWCQLEWPRDLRSKIFGHWSLYLQRWFSWMWKGTGCPSDLGNEAMKPYLVMIGIHSPHSLLRAYPGFSLQSLLTQVWRMHHPLTFVVRSALRQDK